MKNFSNDSFDWQERPQSPDLRIAPPVIARVFDVLPRFRVNVITTFGEILKNVRTTGPALFQSGNAHGRAFGIKKDQLVFVEFIGGSYRSPIVTQVFPFAAKDNDLSNISQFWEKFTFLDPETDILDFHESGYAVRQTTNKIEVYDTSQRIVFELNFQTGEGKFSLSKLKIESDVEITGNVKIEGDTEQTGKIKATGKIESDEGLVSSGTEFNDHGHTYNPGPQAPTKSGPPI
ncbi:baseplate assembly protein [Leptospira barantonii]|uniref:Baseplate assembly protein n=1 Tax=Leptospira barantonii TaxID=2023184 RepID=A0A5F2BHH3_9LEPT|nr:baseplate assembly protein [Leptospira barantonii]TGM04847.1 baseplate assembly protein [Leptospira barantonii]